LGVVLEPSASCRRLLLAPEVKSIVAATWLLLLLASVFCLHTPDLAQVQNAPIKVPDS
jgi:hypothetical protein